jgi:hypothetical protein
MKSFHHKEKSPPDRKIQPEKFFQLGFSSRWKNPWPVAGQALLCCSDSTLQHGAYSVAESAPATNLYFARAHCNVCSKFSMERIK